MLPTRSALVATDIFCDDTVDILWVEGHPRRDLWELLTCDILWDGLREEWRARGGGTRCVVLLK